MYEALTFEAILERMLGRVDDSFDKREGSVIYDALAPAAVESESVYFELDRIFAGIVCGHAKPRLPAAPRGGARPFPQSPRPAPCARGEFSGDVPPGTRFFARRAQLRFGRENRGRRVQNDLRNAGRGRQHRPRHAAADRLCGRPDTRRADRRPRARRADAEDTGGLPPPLPNRSRHRRSAAT